MSRFALILALVVPAALAEGSATLDRQLETIDSFAADHEAEPVGLSQAIFETERGDEEPWDLDEYSMLELESEAVLFETDGEGPGSDIQAAIVTHCEQVVNNGGTNVPPVTWQCTETSLPQLSCADLGLIPGAWGQDSSGGMWGCVNHIHV